MTDDFNEFFDDNTHWVEQGSEPMRGAEPPEPPKSRREMRKRRAQRRRKRISGIIIAIAIVALLIGGGHFGERKGFGRCTDRQKGKQKQKKDNVIAQNQAPRLKD